MTFEQHMKFSDFIFFLSTVKPYLEKKKEQKTEENNQQCIQEMIINK